MGIEAGPAPNLEKDMICFTWQVTSIIQRGKHSVEIYYTKDEPIFKNKSGHVNTKYKKIVRWTWFDRLIDTSFHTKINEAVDKINNKLHKAQRDSTETAEIVKWANKTHSCLNPKKWTAKAKKPEVGEPNAFGHVDDE